METTVSFAPYTEKTTINGNAISFRIEEREEQAVWEFLCGGDLDALIMEYRKKPLIAVATAIQKERLEYTGGEEVLELEAIASVLEKLAIDPESTTRFDNSLLREFEAANYFGGLGNETEEETQTTRTAWLKTMGEQGFALGHSYLTEEFETCSKIALDKSIEQVWG